MNIQAIKDMIARINQDMWITIIKANTTNKPPPLPYAVYNITSPYIKERGQGAQYTDDAGNEIRSEQYRQTISFNGYAEDAETTMELVFNLRQWFLFLGKSYLQENNFAVYQIGGIENRTTFLVDSYEYKYGFDVQLRTSYELARKNDETIETVNIGGI
ncbi:hypothetical protein NG54_03395 [Heyndrickxia ginsengihumi]|uniref:Phage neck terminator protein gp12-like domain-containing protein n=1 Tax=Heyndrickxia ginsengihumi TaxID=363870 RepID=A0A0A6VG26_9BACI|nr:hypothetical protein [Heyndrickxia ginsengihumi]KHD86373.1 hypothetical protein NG54_03395 [Heyndrickxia ginsengihumi]